MNTIETIIQALEEMLEYETDPLARDNIYKAIEALRNVAEG